jgi:hypothetical protein
MTQRLCAFVGGVDLKWTVWGAVGTAVRECWLGQQQGAVSKLGEGAGWCVFLYPNRLGRREGRGAGRPSGGVLVVGVFFVEVLRVGFVDKEYTESIHGDACRHHGQ